MEIIGAMQKRLNLVKNISIKGIKLVLFVSGNSCSYWLLTNSKLTADERALVKFLANLRCKICVVYETLEETHIRYVFLTTAQLEPVKEKIIVSKFRYKKLPEVFLKEIMQNVTIQPIIGASTFDHMLRKEI